MPDTENTPEAEEWTDDWEDPDPDVEGDPEDSAKNVETVAAETPKPAKPSKPKAPSEPSLGDLAVDALKGEWAATVKAQYPLADVDSLGLTGVDSGAKERFFADAKATHEAREAELVSLGYARQSVPGELADEEDARRAAEWGTPVSGSSDSLNSDQEMVSSINEAIGQGPKSTIALLMEKGGLSNFALKRRGG